ncbi:bolA-like protein 3 [Physella acuta]|uniref:bolA-like protein 3 n=1 Tax=Physella acuta TaxID=109671 RepID=UPI0027DD2D87|nr:bolA-like protein 3 [Physella acuta]
MQRILSVLRFQVRDKLNKVLYQSRTTTPLCQQLSTTSEGQASGDLTSGEQHIKKKLEKSFPDATEIQVADVSGGCGAMYQISIESPQFKGLPTIKQHRLVNQALADEIKSMHGLQLTTRAPDTDKQ